MVGWRDEFGDKAPATLVDIAKEWRVHARILDRTGWISLEHNPETRNENLKPIWVFMYGFHCYVYDGEEALRSLTHREYTGTEKLAPAPQRDIQK